MNVRTIAYAGIFGALALVATAIKVPLHFGNPNLGSSPVTIAAALLPLPVGVIAGILKGIGASFWTGQAYIEMPAGIGDAFMAFFTYHLSKRIKPEYAVVFGQLSRYIFTSGAIAISIGLFMKEQGFSGVLAVWVAIFPAVTLSIIANSVVSFIVVKGAGERIKEIVK